LWYLNTAVTVIPYSDAVNVLFINIVNGGAVLATIVVVMVVLLAKVLVVLATVVVVMVLATVVVALTETLVCQ
jgi:hypothetical protein